MEWRQVEFLFPPETATRGQLRLFGQMRLNEYALQVFESDYFWKLKPRSVALGKELLGLLAWMALNAFRGGKYPRIRKVGARKRGLHPILRAQWNGDNKRNG